MTYSKVCQCVQDGGNQYSLPVPFLFFPAGLYRLIVEERHFHPLLPVPPSGVLLVLKNLGPWQLEQLRHTGSGRTQHKSRSRKEGS